MERSISQLVYFSTAAAPFTSPDQLREILADSRPQNQEKDVSGILLFSEKHFMQLLEGPRKEVKDVFSRIQKDNRHNDIVVIMERPVREREFEDVAMGLMGVNVDWTPDPAVPEELCRECAPELCEAFEKYIVTFQRLLDSVGR